MTLKTVSVPAPLEQVFGHAEDVVSRYFSDFHHDPSHATIEISGERYILVRAASLSTEFFSLARRRFDEERWKDAEEFARDILFDLAHAAGKADAENFHRRMHLDNLVDRLSAGPVHFAYMGWASVKILADSRPAPDDSFYLIYDHPKSFEADTWLQSGRRSDGPVCVMNAGYSSGWCETSFGIPLVATEVLCRASGDPCCRFIMAPPDSIRRHVAEYLDRRQDRAVKPKRVIIPEFFVRKRLEDELRDNQQQLLRRNSLLHGINELFEQALICNDTESIAGQFLALARRLTNSPVGFVVERNEANQEITTTAAGLEPDAPWPSTYKKNESPATTKVPLGGWDSVLDSGSSWFMDATEDLAGPQATNHSDATVTTMLSVPLKQGEHTLGTVVLANKPENYTPGDLVIVESLAVAFVQILMRQRAEHSFHVVKHEKHAILDALSDIIVEQLDPAMNIVWCNKRLAKQCGVPPESLEGRKCYEAVYGRETPCPCCTVLDACKTGTPQAGEVTGKDGTIWLSRSTPLKNPDGNVGGVIHVMVDISARRNAERELRKKEEQLQQAQKVQAIGELAGGIAHEFNNLLQVIRGYTAFAMDGLAHQDSRYRDLQHVVEASDRAASLTRQLLGFGRRSMIDRCSLDVGEVVEGLSALVRPVIGEHVECDIKTPMDVGTVLADLGQLQQVLLNLCINARDAMSDKGTLTVRARNQTLGDHEWEFGFETQPGKHVVFTVSDTGCGMPDDVRRRIFEPFFTTKGIGKGTGLGLAMVHGIVHQHHGAVAVESEPGRGTTFSIYLPASESPTRVPNTNQPRAAASHGVETILLADDEPWLLGLGKRILESAGYRVITANDGNEAIDAFERHAGEIELVVLDAVMPGLTGHQVHEHVRARRPSLPAVFCTGYDPKTALSQGLVAADARVVRKPFTADTLLAAVREQLDGVNSVTEQPQLLV